MSRATKLLLWAGSAAALVTAGIFWAAAAPPRRSKKKKSPAPPDPNRPPGERDVPRSPAERIEHVTNTAEGAFEYVGDPLTAKAIRDGRPVIYVISSERPDQYGSAWQTFLINFSGVTRGLPAHYVHVTSYAWPLDRILAGAIYQQSNGIWSATLPTPDLLYEIGEDVSASADAARRMGVSLQRVLAGIEAPAAFSELTPEQARLVRDGATVAQAVEKSASPKGA